MAGKISRGDFKENYVKRVCDFHKLQGILDVILAESLGRFCLHWVLCHEIVKDGFGLDL